MGHEREGKQLLSVAQIEAINKFIKSRKPKIKIGMVAKYLGVRPVTFSVWKKYKRMPKYVMWFFFYQKIVDSLPNILADQNKSNDILLEEYMRLRENNPNLLETLYNRRNDLDDIKKIIAEADQFMEDSK